MKTGEFYEEDEPIEDLMRAFEEGIPALSGQVQLVLEGIAYHHDGDYAMIGATTWEIPERVYVSGDRFRNGTPLGIATVKRLNNGNLHTRVEVVDPRQLVGRPFLAVSVRLPHLTADKPEDPMSDGVLEEIIAFDTETTGYVTRYRILDPTVIVDCPDLFRDYNRVWNRELGRHEWRHNQETVVAGCV